MRRIECSGLFQNSSFSPPNAGRLKEFFSDVYFRNLVKLLKVNFTILWGSPFDWVPLEILTFRVVCTESPAIHRLQFRFSSPAMCPVRASVPESWLPLFTCPSDLGGSGLPCVPPLLWIQEELVFQSVSFLLVVGWSGDFQAPYKQN